MKIQILMPAFSSTMTEGKLVRWLKKVGDKVCAGEAVAEVETNKSILQIEAVGDGTLSQILIPAGTAAVKVNTLLALLSEAGEG